MLKLLQLFLRYLVIGLLLSSCGSEGAFTTELSRLQSTFRSVWNSNRLGSLDYDGTDTSGCDFLRPLLEDHGSRSPAQEDLLSILSIRCDDSIGNEERLKRLKDHALPESVDQLSSFLRFVVHYERAEVLIMMNRKYEASDALIAAVAEIDQHEDRFHFELGLVYPQIYYLCSALVGQEGVSAKFLERTIALNEQQGQMRGLCSGLYNQGTILLEKGEDEQAKQLFRRSLLTCGLAGIDQNTIWRSTMSGLVFAYGRLQQLDSVKIMIGQAKELRSKEEIDEESHMFFQVHALEALVLVKEYDSSEEYLLNLFHYYANECDNKYVRSSLFRSKASIERLRSSRKKEYQTQLERLTHLSSCGEMNEFYLSERLETLGRLKELDMEGGNFEAAVNWQELIAKEGVRPEDQWELLVTQLDYWSDRDKEHVVIENEQKSALLYAQRERFVGLAIFTVLLAMGFYWIFTLYRKNKMMRGQLGVHNEILKDLNETLSGKNKMITSNSSQLEYLNEQLQQQNKNLENFAHIVAHDIKNPLVTISMFSEILKNDLAEGAVTKNSEFVEHIRTESSELIDLIDGILNFASADLDMSKVQRIDMQGLLKELREKYNMRYFKRIDLVIQPGDVCVYAHPLILEQLFANLVNNCVKFKKPDEGARIRIGFKETSDDFVQFYVKDRGIGINEVHQVGVFEQFKRIDTTGKYKGNGIGLATCREIIEKYGGRIWMESTLGVGTTIYFTLRTTVLENPGQIQEEEIKLN